MADVVWIDGQPYEVDADGYIWVDGQPIQVGEAAAGRTTYNSRNYNLGANAGQGLRIMECYTKRTAL